MTYYNSDSISPLADYVDITIHCDGHVDLTIEKFPIPPANYEGDNHEKSTVEGESQDYEFPGGNTITVSSSNAIDGASIIIDNLPEGSVVKINAHEPED